MYFVTYILYFHLINMEMMSSFSFFGFMIRNDNLVNVEIILADVTTHEMDKEFDRVVAIAVFEV